MARAIEDIETASVWCPGNSKTIPQRLSDIVRSSLDGSSRFVITPTMEWLEPPLFDFVLYLKLSKHRRIGDMSA